MKAYAPTRRKFLHDAALTGTGMALGLPFGALSLAQEGGLRVQPLNGSMSLFSGAASNVLVKKAAGGELLAVDGGLERHASALLESIQGHMNSNAVTTLMNTHWHREQTGLNAALGGSGVRIFAHVNTRQWLSTKIARPWEDTIFDPLPIQARPNETFQHYGDLSHGGAPVQYGYLRQAHTDGDMYVYFPEDDVLHAGGVVSNDGWPLLDWWTGGWIGGLVDALETLLTVAGAGTVIVPANGPVMNRQELSEVRDMYATIFQRVREQFMSAYSPEETLAAKPAGEFEDKMGDSDMFILLAHQSVLAHYAPDA